MSTSIARLPGYAELFGKLDIRNADEARSVYAPAAYLADLLQLLDDHFALGDDPNQPGLHQRRPDLNSIPLNAENTFTEVPYLDIVNTVLANAIGGDAFATLKAARSPLQLPFHLEHEQLKQYLADLGIDPTQLYQQFTPTPDPALLARERLGLAPEEHAAIVRPAEEAELRAAFGLSEEQDLDALLRLERFLKATGLSEQALRELLGLDAGDAAELFIHRGLGGTMLLSDDGAALVWQALPSADADSPARGKPPANVLAAWLDRVGRFVLLARKLALGFGQLDLALRSCGGDQLDELALRALAALVQLRDRHGLAIDACCGLLRPPSRLDLGEATTLAELSGPQGKAQRRRLASALGVAEPEVAAIVAQFAARRLDAASDPQLALARFLYRTSALADALDSRPAELFALLDILVSDPSIRSYSSFELLTEGGEQTRDCYAVLAGDDAPALLWLLQILFAITQWMRANDFGGEELAQILAGRAADPAAQARVRSQKIAALDNLYQQFKPLLLDASAFISERFDERAARVIFEAVTAPGAGVVSPRDQRLLRLHPAQAPAAAYAAITQLGSLRAADFQGLGLADRLLDKIFRNLILREHLIADGKIIEPRLPKNATDFVLAGDFQAQQEPLFALIAGLLSDDDRAALQDDDAQALADLTLYPSDLEELAGLTAAQRDELYDNLVFNGYIDADGTVLQPDFFAQDEPADFMVNANLGPLAEAVLAQLTGQLRQFEAAPLALEASIFADLPLTRAEAEALLQNLRFNEYIDANNVLTNKRALLTLSLADFSLAPDFYALAHPILDAIQQHISEFQDRFCTLTRETFRTLAEAAVARRVLAQLAAEHLRDGRPSPAAVAFFSDSENQPLFQLGTDFTAAECAIVFDRIAGILAWLQPYQLPLAALAEQGFDDEETAALLEVLRASGYLDDLRVAQGELDFFLNADNALVFTIEAFEDYNQDIFFLLSEGAQAIAAASAEIVAALTARAEQQIGAVLAAFQDAFGVDTEVMTVLCAHVICERDRLVEAVLPPVLAAVDSDNQVTAEPADSTFTLAYRRMGQFALLASKLGLSGQESAVAFRDQDLAAKFPEKLALPPGLDRFDALWASPEGPIYLFAGQRFWRYAAQTYALLAPDGLPLRTLSEHFADLAQVDAAFTDAAGGSVIIGRDAGQRSRYFYRAGQAQRWQERPRAWGQLRNTFADPAAIDTAFQDREGKIYLFAGDQYIRYSHADQTTVDEGYPRRIAGNWQREGLNAQLSARFKAAIDASFQGADDQSYLFKDHVYVSSDALGTELEIRSKWGRVRNTFAGAAAIDAAYADGASYYLFAGDQLAIYDDSLEHEQVLVREGYPRRIEAHFPNLPAEFESGLEVAFRGADGRTHLFKDGQTIAFHPGDQDIQPAPTASRWGRVSNAIREQHTIDAAFVGLDGKTYLFAGDQYVRYSGADYALVDAGYPRRIADDWGGLASVDAAFVLDGKTYLFGRGDSGAVVYVRYSRRDYTAHDEGYPKAPNDNWWNLPVALVQDGAPFERIDAVLCGKDNRTYLFSGEQFIVFDHKERWWSEPQRLSVQWDSIPFDVVDAAFVGKDGRTYIFSGDQYVRYSGSYSKVDDRYPNSIHTYWGNVANTIARTGRVDAALVLEVPAAVGEPQVYTYLFSGNQYVRYTGSDYASVDLGYPKLIASSLRQEPRFANLPALFDSGLDAAFADRRNLHVFKGQTWHVLASSLYQTYSLDAEQARSAFFDEGALVVETSAGWQHLGALEGVGAAPAPADPALLRAVPAQFRQGLDAVLKGADGNTYLFKGGDCFNLRLGKAYPLAEEWGRPRNNIEQLSRIDAAFVGRDNRTYLFCDDQFVTYAGAVYTEIDGQPRSIASHWGGLTSVALAYVRGEQTFLLERPDDQGSFRYVRYSTADYTRPDQGFPQTASADFWQIPDQYREGFGEVRAVLPEGENLLLIGPAQYLQLHEPSGAWSYPRPLSRVWHTIKLDHQTFPGVRTAFGGADGVTYFFGDEHFMRYGGSDQPAAGNGANGVSTLTPIRERWGRMRNNFVGQPGRVDAALTLQGQITYLFAGDQYVRYSSADYRVVDQGYPRPILGNLRQEAGFHNLPDSFEDLLAERLASPDGRAFDAALADDRSLYLFIGSQCHVVSQSLTATYDLSRLGRVKNRLADAGRVDAALVRPDAQGLPQTFLFAGDQYVRYSGAAYDHVDDGYPRSIAAALAQELGVAELPAAFRYGLDAALRAADGSIYLFKGREYLKLGESAPRPIAATWGHVRNRFAEGPAGGAIDAAWIAADGSLYVFAGDQYARYQSPEQPEIDEGYPRAIKDNWGDLPPEFEAGIDGGFVFESATYLIKQDAYVRYSQPGYARIDPIYPQRFLNRWGIWSDYLLSDICAIARFKQLHDTYAGAELGLADFLNMAGEAIQSPYEQLAAIFHWDAEEVKWLKRRNGFLGGKPLFEQQFQLELILRLFDAFALADKLKSTPSEVFTSIWQPRYVQADHQRVNAALERALALVLGEKAWPVRAGQLHSELNLRKRDALLAYLLARADGIEHASDLYERYLIDVEMGGVGTASRVQEAIAATQLYVHRYLLNLEPALARDGDGEATRQAFKRWWAWMKNYRVWEANRKVFLYPENYIRPELRDTKTPAFKALEDDLLQGEITAESAQRAYKKYLDEYTEVSTLTIAGGYVYQPEAAEGVERRLVLFGRTKTDPRRYYYRTAEFLSDARAAALWSAWQSVNVQIDADLVYPVLAFNRVFVFWARLEAVADAPGSATITRTSSNGKETLSSSAPPTYAIKIFYSFYNLNKEWVPAQQLRWGAGAQLNDSIRDSGPITQLKLFVESSDKLVLQRSASDHDNIIINCSYRSGLNERNQAFSLLPERYCKQIDKPDFDNNGAAVFDSIFDEPSFDQSTVVRFNTLEQTTDGPWFSFDHKGGSFLCRPDEPPISANTWPRRLATNPEGLPRDWERIDAAVVAPDGNTYLFNNTAQVYRAYRFDAASGMHARVGATDPGYEQAIRQRWGLRRNAIALEGKVDAAITLGVTSYLFRGGEYLTYSQGLELADADGPHSLAQNSAGLPTTPVDAAFTGLDGTTYFFFNQTQFAAHRQGQLDTPAAVKERWGKARPAPVTLAFTNGAMTYLVYGGKYVRYQGGAHTSVEPGYPQAFGGLADLPGLAAARPASSVDPRRIANAFYADSALFFQYQGDTQLQRLEIKSGSDASMVDFRKHLNEEPLVAVAVRGPQIYAFKRKSEGHTTLCIYNVDAGAEPLSAATRELAAPDDDQISDRALPRKPSRAKDRRSEDEHKGDKSDKGDKTEPAGRWTHHTIAITRQGQPMAIDHALIGSDGTFYLFAGDEYMQSGDWAALAASGSIAWVPTGSISRDWLRQVNRIAETGMVDAALVRGQHTYLISGDQYVRYTGHEYQYIDEGYPRALPGNADGLPGWPQIGAIFSAPDGTIYYFDNSDPSPAYVIDGRLDQPQPTRARWGIIRNAITESGVDAAFVRGDTLFLTRGSQFVRYTLADGKTIGSFIDDGYPRTLALKPLIGWPDILQRNALQFIGITQIDAAYARDGVLYLFSGGRYFTLPAGDELDALPMPAFIKGNWGNVPIALRAGIDATLAYEQTLYLFQGGQYARYADGSGPYEIAHARFAIVRLTSGTASTLNQRLFAGGVSALLSQSTQETDELPSFSEGDATATNIRLRPGKASYPPISSHLDFDSANGIYYWEIFFHAPLLIAQALSVGQKFAEARQWYEYIYDPTERTDFWKFLPFLIADLGALIGSCQAALADLRALDIDVAGLASTFEGAIVPTLERWADVFQQRRVLGAAEEAQLAADLAALTGPLDQLAGTLGAMRAAQERPADATEQAVARRVTRQLAELQERVAIMGKLWQRYELLGNYAAQIRAYQNDPFDPHAIAALRTAAYRKAVVMGYINNLLDWGDMLFRQYTRESIDEARMLYILAYDLLGARPQSRGARKLAPEQSYAALDNTPDAYELAIYPKGTSHDSVDSSYFYIPENSLFGDYWGRVEDRLYKIRQSLNILGISQPLPLFEPPIDPMALVRAVGAGAPLSGVLTAATIAVPHYRFSFLLRKAQELVQNLNGLSSDLLGALEKRDAEELSLLQNRQEATILSLTRAIKQAQLKAAGETIKELETSLQSAQDRTGHYRRLIDVGMSPIELAQIGSMQMGSNASFASVGLKIAAGITYLLPDVTLGLFSFGAKTGGIHVGDALSGAAEASESLSEGFSMAGEVLGMYASHLRTVEDWQLQLSTAQSDVAQIGHQLAGARLQEQIAQRELEIHEKQIEQNAAISTFMQEKFTSAQLYQWMAGKLAGLYFQSYGMAYDMARAAEKALQFERGLPEGAASYIQPLAWESQRKGLLAGASLGLDLNRMEKAAIESDSRGFEIARQISLLALDPLALLQLKRKGACEFALTEALFDADFPGHYRRQIRTLELVFVGADGQRLPMNATLTQLGHKTVLEPDARAVKFLLDPKDQPPPSLRSDWKASQQIALSQVAEGEQSNGLFELRYDDDRYLPFEGTGAISTWRLELGGPAAAASELADVTIALKYTADQGGALFATTVKGLLKPAPAARYFDLARDFPDAWQAFIEGEEPELTLTLTRDLFPSMSSSRLTSLFAHYQLSRPAQVSFVLNDDEALTLADGRLIPAGGLSIAGRGSEWSLALHGDKAALANIGLVVGYTAQVE